MGRTRADMDLGARKAGEGMVYKFSETKELNERLEKELQSLKKDYMGHQMSGGQLKELQERIEEAKRMDRKERGRKRIGRAAAVAAVFAAAFVALPNTSAGIAHAMEQIPVIGGLVEVVTFRDYRYDSDRNMADVQVPEIQVSLPQETEEGTENEVQEKLDRTTEEINAEIQRITGELIEEFEANLQDEEGYQDILVKSEVLTSTPDYFTLKLICYQGAGSGYQWNYFYTIDLNTGERLRLKDIFAEGADFITPISENIKEQMRTQMAEDESVYYWLEDEIEEWNFQSITEETSFYLNGEDHVVICFNEGDVAPMYMGTVEFEIPEEVLSGIRK